MTESTPQNPEASGKPSPILIVFLIFPILGLLAAVALAVSSGVGAGSTPPTPAPITLQDTSIVDKPAPNFELAALDSTRLRLSNYRGRIVFMNFWATWCEPCVRELPAFQQFQAEQGMDGAVILAVNAGETADAINSYFADHHISGLTVLLDSNLDVLNAYAVDRFPTTYVIDAAGTVRYKHYGEMNGEDMVDYIDKLT